MKLRWRGLRDRELEEGFTLIELVVALFVFALLLVAVGSTLMQSIGLSRTNQQRITAANVAQRQIEAVRSVPATQLLTSPVLRTQPAPVRIGGTVYYLDQRVQYVNLAPTGTAPQSCGGLDVARISVSVRWANMDGVTPVTSDTVRSLGQAGIDPAKGSIGVQVTNAAGSPDAGLPVTLIGPSGSSVAFTDSEGCALFPQLVARPSAYAVQLNSAGWTDPAGKQDSRVLNLTVSPSQITRVPMTYDQSATLQIQLSGTSAALPLNPQPIPVTVKNNAGTQVVRMDSAGLYRTGVAPVPEGYVVWSGDCADANPAAWGSAGQPAVPVAKGQTALASAPVVEVGVTGAPAGTPVYAVHAAAAGCPSGEVFFLGYGDVRSALPYGRWTFANRPDLTSPPPGGWVTVDIKPTSVNPLSITGRFN